MPTRSAVRGAALRRRRPAARRVRLRRRRGRLRHERRRLVRRLPGHHPDRLRRRHCRRGADPGRRPRLVATPRRRWRWACSRSAPATGSASAATTASGTGGRQLRRGARDHRHDGAQLRGHRRARAGPHPRHPLRRHPGALRPAQPDCPTIGQPDGVGPYQTTWEQQLEMVGQALGKTERGRRARGPGDAGVRRRRRASIRSSTAPRSPSAAYSSEGFGAYVSGDARVAFLEQLGFVNKPAIDDLATDNFFVPVSDEQLSLLRIAGCQRLTRFVWGLDAAANCDHGCTGAERGPLFEARSPSTRPPLGGCFR